MPSLEHVNSLLQLLNHQGIEIYQPTARFLVHFSLLTPEQSLIVLNLTSFLVVRLLHNLSHTPIILSARRGKSLDKNYPLRMIHSETLG